jgi:putative oxidoreductase
MNRETARDITLTLLRLVVGLLFVQHGGMKLLGWFGGIPGGRPPLGTEVGISGVLELFGGAAIFAGLLTQPVAFLLSGEMAVAYWQAHAPNGTWPIQNGGEPAVLYCFIFFYMAAHGAGPWSVDGWLARRKTPPRRTGT